jgi:hypothetical protein
MSADTIGMNIYGIRALESCRARQYRCSICPTPSAVRCLMLTPGHTSQDLSVIVENANGVAARIHPWWHPDRTPEGDPLAENQAALETSRQRIRAAADRV